MDLRYQAILIPCSRHSSKSVTFPPPTDININMMPFVMADSFEECQLPDFLEPYWPFIEQCSSREAVKDYTMFHKTSDKGKICYLTVQESFVESGQSQRRPGLHVDCPGYVKIKNEEVLRKNVAEADKTEREKAEGAEDEEDESEGEDSDKKKNGE